MISLYNYFPARKSSEMEHGSLTVTVSRILLKLGGSRCNRKYKTLIAIQKC